MHRTNRAGLHHARSCHTLAGEVISNRTISTIIDMADIDGDDQINYGELSAVIECEDILELAALVPDKKVRLSLGRGIRPRHALANLV